MSTVKRLQSSLLYCNFPQKVSKLTRVEDSVMPNLADYIDTNTPCLVYMANGRIHDLEGLEHNKKTRDYLNKHGLHIYLYEPLCSYYTEDPCALHGRVFNMGFYSEFPNVNDSFIDIHAAELDSIEEYVKLNKLYDVTVYTGDYNVHIHYQSQTTHMNLSCYDVCLKKQAFNLDTITKKKTHFKKKFISTNWRFTPARAAVCTMLCKRSSHIAWYYRVHRDILTHSPWFDYEVAKQNPAFYRNILLNVDRLNDNSPWCLDMHTETALEIQEPGAHFYPQLPGQPDAYSPTFHNDHHLTLEQFYRESFVDIVCESRYAQPTGNLSEKTFQPIQYMTPFVLVAPPRSLEYLKTLGFKTFSRWWDESYDTETNHIKRLMKVFDIIEYIDSLNDDELSTMYKQMFPTLKKNRKILKDFLKNNQINKDILTHIDTQAVQWISKDHAIQSKS